MKISLKICIFPSKSYSQAILPEQFLLLAPNTDDACEWKKCTELQVPWKWLLLAFTDNIQVSKDTVTEMLHLSLSKVRNKCDDCSTKYLQKNLPAGTAGRKMSVPTKGHNCTPQTTARTLFIEVSQQVAKKLTFFFSFNSRLFSLSWTRRIFPAANCLWELLWQIVFLASALPGAFHFLDDF